MWRGNLKSSVIISIHGTGLALSIFAPKESDFIEIELSYRSLSLFEILTAGAMCHDMICLLRQSTQDIWNVRNLLSEDETHTAKSLKEHLLELKHVSKWKQYTCFNSQVASSLVALH